ncbi:hypothetical protein CPB86DRAFT_827128 [Serendipita vermifera]|nr:hypothetical protein CPB86DRAFT_827128 [Serendipita vermifera]
MQRRVKTYGKRSTRIVTVSEPKQTATTRPNATETRASPASSDSAPDSHLTASLSNDDDPIFPSHKQRPTKKALDRESRVDGELPATTSDSSKLNASSAPPPNAMGRNNANKKSKGNNTRVSNVKSAPLEEPNRAQRMVSPPPKTQKRVINSASPQHVSRTKKRANSPVLSLSDDTDSSEPPPRNTVTTRRRRYIPSESSGSSSEFVASEEEPELVIPISDSDSELSSVESIKPSKQEASGTKLNGAKGKPSRTSTSSIASIPHESVTLLPQHRPKGKRSAPRNSESSQSAISDHNEEAKGTVPAKAYIHVGTPQVKAFHLRQARQRKATPFRPIPRISFGDSSPLSPTTPLLPAKELADSFRSYDTKPNQFGKRIDLQFSDSITSSPLTWENTITPEATRRRDSLFDSPFPHLNLPSTPPDGNPKRVLSDLLQFCKQDRPMDFQTFLDVFKNKDLEELSKRDEQFKRGKTRTAQRTSLKYHKIGDASYSEVYGIGDVVLKIIPLAAEVDGESGSDESLDGKKGDDIPFKSSPENVLKEMMITKITGDLNDGFISLLRSYIISGKYPKMLLREWDEYKRDRGSESTRPDSFNEHQLYAVIILPYAGVDLESYAFGGGSAKNSTVWRDAADIFWQVSNALAGAEEKLRFEHRDLHWGQIVIRKLVRQDTMESAVNATIIDLGLSRIETDGRVHFTMFEEDVFTGRGIYSNPSQEVDDDIEPDYQFDVYRMMRHHNEDDWTPFRPLSNVMWLHYLVHKLLKHKGLRKPPSVGRASVAPTSSKLQPAINPELHAYQRLVTVEAALDHRLKGLRDAISGKAKPTKGRATMPSARDKKTANSSQPDKSLMSTGPLDSATDVVTWWLTTT